MKSLHKAVGARTISCRAYVFYPQKIVEFCEKGWLELHSTIDCDHLKVPKFTIHYRKIALETVLADVSLMGMAVDQRENRPTIVRRYWYPWHIGNGPTMSTCMWEKRASGLLKVPIGDLVCQCTLHFWYSKHSETHSRTSEFILGHTKRSATSLTVASLFGWDSLCKCWNTHFLSCGGMYDLGEPNLTSQYSVMLLKGAGNSWRAKEVSDNTLGSVESHFCSSAIKSWLKMSLSSALSSVLESVSATVLFSPFTYRRSVVSCEI